MPKIERGAEGFFVGVHMDLGQGKTEYYSLMDDDIFLMKGEYFGKACDAFLESAVFFMAWPDILTQNKNQLVVMCGELAFFDGKKLKLYGDTVLFVNRVSRKIVDITYKTEQIIECDAAMTKKINDERRLAREQRAKAVFDPLRQRVLNLIRYDGLPSSNMVRRADDDGHTIWTLRGEELENP